MEKLSIEEKAKAYDKALERAKVWKEKSEMPKDKQGILDDIFPELAESEDERIRKELIKFVKVNIADEERYIAWLEKQGEKKPADMVKPKFKVGDWIVDGIDTVYQIKEIKEDVYLLQFYNSSDIISLKISTIDNDCHLWTIEDAKAGNVLVTEPINGYPSPFIAIYKERGLDFFNSYCFVGFDGKFYEADTGHSTEEIHPATKEQRELLFKKMHEASYEWDAEKKELNKIEKNSFESDRVEKAMHEAGYEWSEETHQLKKIEQNLTWSEEDEDRLKSCLNILQAKDTMGIIIETINTKWLKSLKERCTWKPSDEQLNALHDAAMYVDKSMFPYPKGILMKLHKQLKKLREE